MIGRQEPIKLLLNQRDPGQIGRVLVYYQYFGRARASQIAAIDAHLAEINELDSELAAEEQRLLALEQQQRGEVSRLQSARERRGKALVSLDAESKNRAKELDRLKEQQGGLEKLVRELRRALERIEKFPTDSKDAFARLRGKLAWPVAGKLVASYGQVRAGGMKWDGVLLAGAQGTPVRAVYHGRVVYADWLSGLGLLTIIDHGDGYLSLYGHNERLYKEVGERVTAGRHHRHPGGLRRPAAGRAVLRDPQGGQARRSAAVVQDCRAVGKVVPGGVLGVASCRRTFLPRRFATPEPSPAPGNANCINEVGPHSGHGPPLMSFENSMEPYAQLVRSLLPRASALCLFDGAGKLLWSSVASTNPELFALVLQGIAHFDAQEGERSRTPSASTARCPTTRRPIYSGCATSVARWPRWWPWSATGWRTTRTCCRSRTCTITCVPRSSCCAVTCWRAPTSRSSTNT